MRKLIIFSVSLITILTFCCCGDKGTPAVSSADKNFDAMFDRVVTSPGIDSAKVAISTAAEKGEISEGQKKYLEAVVVYRGFMRFDSVLTMCQPLVEKPEVKADKLLLYRIYALMANAAEAYGSYADMIQYASRTVTLARELGKIDKEQEMIGTVGYGMVLLGRSSEGLQMIDKALATLARQRDWNCCNSYIILSKIKIGSFDELNRPDGVLDVCRDVLDKLDDMEDNPDNITNMPSEWKTNKDSFIAALSLYRSQMNAYMAYAYAKIGQRENAMKSLADFDKSSYSSSPDANRIIVLALGELGLYDRMLATYRAIDNEIGGDTINQAYSEELQFKAKAASSVGNYAEARQYLRRTIALNDTLYKLRDQEQMARMLTVYKVHDEQVKANAASSAAKMMLVIVVALTVITVVTIVLMILIYRQNRYVNMKNKRLVGMIESMYDYKEKYKELVKEKENKIDETAENCINQEEKTIEKLDAPLENMYTDSNDAHLFAKMDIMIREKEMYLDPDFQRQTLVDELGIDRNKIGKLIHDFSGCSNLSAYINSFRLEYACRLLLRGDNGLTIDNVARQSGFSTVRTFQRLFKEAYGMTPAEFREAR